VVTDEDKEDEAKGGFPTNLEKMQWRRGLMKERKRDEMGELMGRFGAGINSRAQTARTMSRVFRETESGGR